MTNIEQKILNEMRALGNTLKSCAEKENLTNKSIQSNTGMAINTIKSVWAGEAGNLKSYLEIAKIFELSLFDLVEKAKSNVAPSTPSKEEEAPVKTNTDTPLASMVTSTVTNVIAADTSSVI